MSYQIAFVRHAKTPGNEQGRYIGSRTDEGLSELGIRQLRDRWRAGDEIREYSDGFTSVFVSPMKRCQETARILGAADYLVIEELSEIDFGEFENHNYEELNGRSDYQSWIDSGGMADYPGGESLSHFLERNQRAFQKMVSVLQREKKQKALVVCHGGNIMAIFSQLTGENYYDFQMANAEGYLLEFDLEENEVVNISYRRI